MDERPEEVIVSLHDGKVRGIKQQSPFFDAEFYSFYGIPYAESPIGDLRFKDPMKFKPRKSIHDGSRRKEGCIQFSMFQHRLIGSEDCLYVNVHTPRLPCDGEPLRAVIAFIHPGGQLWGSPESDHHGSPNFIMQHDVVYVTIAYRLNIFGFLNLNVEGCSGNQGLKDIIMAFRWIKENIKEFNGDPENVTAAGSSSGAVLVHLLMLSPITEGLFHKAILMGQYIFNCFTPYTEDQVKIAFEFAADLGFEGNDSRKLLKFLKKMPAQVLVIQMKIFMTKIDQNIVKSYSGGPFKESMDQSVIPVPPRQLIGSTKRIPIIFGICDKEAVIGFIRTAIRTVEICYETSFRQNIWGWMHELDDQDLKQIHQQIQSFYYNDASSKHQPLSVKVDISSDAAFSEVYDTIIDLISADLPSSVYVYKFQYDGEISELKKQVSKLLQEKLNGTFHCDDISYWAHINTPRLEKTARVVYTFTKLLTTFAKTGNPNYQNIETKWEPSTQDRPYYLDINEKLTLVQGQLNKERFEFWNMLKKRFKRD